MEEVDSYLTMATIMKVNGHLVKCMAGESSSKLVVVHAKKAFGSKESLSKTLDIVSLFIFELS